MGAIDRATKKFIKDNEVFADAVNLFQFNGVRRILPEYLSDMDSVQTLVFRGKTDRKTYSNERYRDAVKRVSLPGGDEFAFMITGFENQTVTDCSMPVRNMLYDSMSYIKQVCDKSVSDDGGFPRFPEGEKLLPVMTIVINYGKEPWSGPMTLHELLDTNDKKILKNIPDYRINLIDPHTMTDEEIEKTQTNLREVLYCIKYSNDKNKLDKIISEKHERFEMISLNAKNVIENVNCLTVPRNRKGGYNMCKAIEGMKEDAEKKGARKNQDALIEALQAIGVSEELIQNALEYMENKKKEESN